MNCMGIKKQDTGSNALIDHVRPCDGGALVGAVFATYGLSLDNPDFFGTDFLPTVLGLGTSRNRGFTAPATMNHELAKSDVVLIHDARAVDNRTRPTLRVDVLQIGHKVHHAKVVLLHRERHIRLVISSANLTSEGYRSQREMAVVLDFHPGGAMPASVLENAVARWREVMGDRANEQVLRVWSEAVESAQRWKLPRRSSIKGNLEVLFGGGPKPLWRHLVDAWPAGEPISHWCICSPFWPEPDGGRNTNPFIQLADALSAKRAALDKCKLEIITCANGATDQALPCFPFAMIDKLRKQQFPITEGTILPARLGEMGDEDSDDKGAERKLHAKWVVLAGPRTVIALVGSANFTRKGLGTLKDPEKANIEACVLMKFPRGQWSPEQWRPPILGRSVDWGKCSGKDLQKPSDEDLPTKDWPDFIRGIELVVSHGQFPDGSGRLLVRLGTADWPRFVIKFDNAPQDQDDLPTIPCPPRRTKKLGVPLAAAQVRTLLTDGVLEIVWEDGNRKAWFPVNLTQESKVALPSLPGMGVTEEQLLAYFHGKVSADHIINGFEQQSLDGSSDSNGQRAGDIERLRQLQNYVVREFVESLYGMSQRLSEACFSLRATEQALIGEFSPVSLAEQIVRALEDGRRSPTAAAFQLVELIRVVSDLKVPIAGFDKVQGRAFRRLFGCVEKAAAQPGFGGVIGDPEFSSFVAASLTKGMAKRWTATLRRSAKGVKV